LLLERAEKKGRRIVLASSREKKREKSAPACDLLRAKKKDRKKRLGQILFALMSKDRCLCCYAAQERRRGKKEGRVWTSASAPERKRNLALRRIGKRGISPV